MKTVGKSLIIISLVAAHTASAYAPVLPYVYGNQQQRPNMNVGGGYVGGQNYVPNYTYNQNRSFNAPATAAYRYGGGQQFNGGGFNGGGFRQAPNFASPWGYGRPGPRYIGPQYPYSNGFYGQNQQSNSGGGLLGGLLQMLLSGFGGGNGGGGIFGGLFGGGNRSFNNGGYNTGGQNYSNYNSAAIPDLTGGGYQQQGPAVAPYQQTSAIPDLTGGGNPAPAVAPVQVASNTQVATATDAIPDLTGGNQAPAVAPVQTAGNTDPIPDLTGGGAPAVVEPQQRSDVARTDDTVRGTPAPRSNVPASPRTGSVRTVPDTLTPGEIRQVRAINQMERRAQQSPVWRPFIRRFQQCAPGCEPIGYHAFRHSRMCHNSGSAIDVFGMQCADGRHMATQSTKTNGRFAQLVNCMVGERPARGYRNLRIKDGLGGLWHNGHDMTQGHRNHAHFSIGCGRGVW